MTTSNIVYIADCPKIDSLLNDPETNYLADLFLARFRIENVRRYRHFKNAVIVFSHAKFDADEIFDMLAKSADMTTDGFLTELRATIDNLPEPVCNTFNRYYSNPDGYYDTNNADAPRISMTDKNSISYIFGFLGYAFLLIILNNYPIYNAVKLLKE